MFGIPVDYYEEINQKIIDKSKNGTHWFFITIGVAKKPLIVLFNNGITPIPEYTQKY